MLIASIKNGKPWIGKIKLRKARLWFGKQWWRYFRKNAMKGKSLDEINYLDKK